jgi:hypothetical protein
MASGTSQNKHNNQGESMTIKTWRERIGVTEDFPLTCATSVERAMSEEIAELRKALEIREGWKLVPLEADDDMISAACEAANLFRVDAMRAIEAAIAAAPEAGAA